MHRLIDYKSVIIYGIQRVRFQSLLILFGCLTVFALSLKAQKKKDIKKHPNIIFLLTDDQRWNAMGAMGNNIIQTPNMDALAKSGMLFKNAYVTTPICAVSRAGILSGKYARRLGIWGFNTFFSDSDLAQTYPMILRREGYFTGFIGKWGVGDSGKNTKGGVETDTMTGKQVMDLLKTKFDYYYAWPGQGHYIHKLPDGKTIHLTRIVEGKIKQFLDETPQNRPFCLSVSFKAPHVQDQKRAFIPEPRLDSLYKGINVPRPPTDKPEYFNGLPDFLQQSEARVRWVETFHHYKGREHSYEEAVKDYYRLITGVDMVIGSIRKQLKERGEDQNTIIVFMGDNGQMMGDYQLIGKWYGYESSVRVPLVIYDPLAPDSARGRVQNDMALNIDIAPTILDLAGMDIPWQMQGRSLVPLLEGRQPQWRNDFLFEHLFNVTWVNIPMSQGVISKRYVYIQYLDHHYKEMYEQLFDLKKDPYEVHNLARDPACFEILETLRNRMYSLIQQNK